MSLPHMTAASGNVPEADSDVAFLRGIVAILVATRKSRGVTLRELGESTGYNWGYLSRAERGLTQPGVVSLCKWCRALGLDFVGVAQQAKESKD